MAWNVLINDSDCEWIKSMSSFRLGPTPKANGWLGMNDYSCKMIMSESSRWAHLDLDRPPKASLGWLFLLFKQLTVAGLFADETFLDCCLDPQVCIFWAAVFEFNWSNCSLWLPLTPAMPAKRNTDKCVKDSLFPPLPNLLLQLWLCLFVFHGCSVCECVAKQNL